MVNMLATGWVALCLFGFVLWLRGMVLLYNVERRAKAQYPGYLFQLSGGPRWIRRFVNVSVIAVQLGFLTISAPHGRVEEVCDALVAIAVRKQRIE